MVAELFKANVQKKKCYKFSRRRQTLKMKLSHLSMILEDFYYILLFKEVTIYIINYITETCQTDIQSINIWINNQDWQFFIYVVRHWLSISDTLPSIFCEKVFCFLCDFITFLMYVCYLIVCFRNFINPNDDQMGSTIFLLTL